ncbi:unnamed protein product [Symbiodinium sp. CCMP2592]|nr:unnamed protein product [Symbiodinium sp. CCMP2592]
MAEIAGTIAETAGRQLKKKVVSQRLLKALDSYTRLAEAPTLNFEEIAEAEAEAARIAEEQAKADRLAQEKAAQEKEEADRLAQEKEKADRLAQEKVEARRLAQEKEKADRLAQAIKEKAARLAQEAEEKEMAAHLAQEKEKADRLAQEAQEKEKANRLAQEKEKAHRLAREKEEADRLAQEKEEADRLALEKEKADRLAQEKEEADRLAQEKEKADRLAREKAEADRLAQEKEKADRFAEEATQAGHLAEALKAQTDALETQLDEDLQKQITTKPGLCKVAAAAKHAPASVAPSAMKARDQFQAGGKERENVYKLFAQCQHNPEIFMNKYSATHEKESELQVSVEFEYLTKKEMADDHNMSKKTDRVKTSETREIEAAGEGTEEMDVDLGEALELPPSSLQANCQQPATLADAADGLTQTPPPNEEVSKLLKRLGYPEVHDCKASALIDKAVGACTKRLKKLAELLPSDSCPPPDPAAQTANMDLKEKTCPQPMYNKIRSVYAAVDSCSEALEKYKADGLVDGFTEQYRFGFIGAKGDADWHFDAGSFNRSYHRIGPVNPAKICPWCDAGSEGFPYTDVSSAPKWLETVGASDPWDEDPPLSAIPFSESFGAFMYKNDPFHVLKFGIFRDATASCVTRLAQLGFWDFDSENELQNVPDRLSRAYGCYRLWCAANKKLPALKGFTRANMHYDTNSAFAWFNTKGSEVVILLQWLDFQVSLFLRDVQVENHRAELSAMKQLVRGGLDYIGIMHSHGIWLPQSCARVKLDSGLTFARGYAYMASRLTAAGASGFRLRPKLHYFMHMLTELQQQLDSREPFLLNAGLWLCESNEDFVGRVARVSRRVHPQTAAVRCLQRYLVKVRFLLERLSR